MSRTSQFYATTRLAEERRNTCGWFSARTGSCALDDPQGFLDCLGRTFDDEKLSSCRPLRLSRTLFPMAQRVDAEPEPARELFLRHVQTCPDRLHVDLSRHMDAIGAVLRSISGTFLVVNFLVRFDGHAFVSREFLRWRSRKVTFRLTTLTEWSCCSR